MPMAEAVHHEAEGGYVVLLALREVIQASILENSALQSQRITKRYTQGLGGFQPVHPKPSVTKKKSPLT
jgi:hypothetical protein